MVNETIEIKLPYGDIEGYIQDDIAIFKGIPYAKPPIGKLRFTPPQDVDPWKNTLDCTKYRNSAIQNKKELLDTNIEFTPQENQESFMKETPLAKTGISEDCLYLNIWTPKDIKNKKLPVLFWIHGGGFYSGCGSYDYFIGDEFAKNDVILVTINYRLGPLGFLALKTSLDEYQTTGNWGTLDQIKALQWVNDNISLFGGDPNKITIAGQSAGSFSISNLIMSPKAKGLFNQAIMESGSIFANKVAVPFTESKLDKSIEMSREFAKIFGAEDTKEGLELLRDIDAETLHNMGYFSSDYDITCPYAFWAVEDGNVLPKDPVQSLKNGKYNKVKVISGYTQNEGIVFFTELMNSESMWEKYVYQSFKSDNARKVLNYINKGNPFEKAVRCLNGSYFKAGITFMQETMADQGIDVYAYEFNYSPQGNYPLAMLGAHHTVELPFVFGLTKNLGLKFNEKGQNVEKQIHNMWINFVKNGDPNNGLDLPYDTKWNKYNSSNTEIFYFDTKMSTGKRPKEDIEDIKFFKDILEL